jgi:chromosomal replication initiation ATPase DnaA
MRELEFNFLDKNEYDINNFIVYNENIEAFYYLNQEAEDIKYSLAFLSGSKKSGKTYISNIWKQRHNAKHIDCNLLKTGDFDDFIAKITEKIEVFDYYLIDDFGKDFDEHKLLFLINCVIEKHSKLLIISDFDFNKIRIKTKDLKSRTHSSVFLKIKKLPKEIKPMFILKLFSDKKISVSSAVLKFLLQKLPNDYESIYNFVRKINIDAREKNEKITVERVKKFLANM